MGKSCKYNNPYGMVAKAGTPVQNFLYSRIHMRFAVVEFISNKSVCNVSEKHEPVENILM